MRFWVKAMGKVLDQKLFEEITGLDVRLISAVEIPATNKVSIKWRCTLEGRDRAFYVEDSAKLPSGRQNPFTLYLTKEPVTKAAPSITENSNPVVVTLRKPTVLVDPPNE